MNGAPLGCALSTPPSKTRARRLILGYGVGMLLLLPVLLLGSTERFTITARLLAWLGFGLSLLPSLVMLCRPQSRTNAVAAIGLIVAVSYHLAPLHERALVLRWGQARISDSSVEIALLLAALSVPALWLGWYLCGYVPRRMVPRLRLEVPAGRLRVTAYVIVVWSLLVEFLWLTGQLTTYQPAVSVLSVLAPLELGFAMLLVPRLRGEGTTRDQLLFWACLGTAALVALARGTLLVVIRPFLIYLLGWLFVARRVQLLPVVAALGMVLLMQPVKGEFRHRVWDRQTELGVMDRAALYVELIEQHWFPTDADPLVDRGQSVETAAARTGATLALSNVVELTPQAVPHQYGATLHYLKYALVPRVLYPDKPISQWADVWAAVMYGYTNQQGTAHVMIGLSQISESYINFGLLGGLVWLMFSGALARMLDELLSHKDAGNGGLSLYLYMVLALTISLEGSFAQFWGGVIQLCVAYGIGLAILGRRGVRVGSGAQALP